jgi:hypothetical protein
MAKASRERAWVTLYRAVESVDCMYRNRYLLDPVKAFRTIPSHSQCGSMPTSQLPLSPLAYLPLGALGALLCRVAGLACLHLQALGNPA